MYQYTYENPVPAVWGPYNNGYAPNQTPQHDQMFYDANHMFNNTNHMYNNANHIYNNANQIYYNANWDYRVPINYHSSHYMQQQAVPHMNVMQPMLPVHRQSAVTQEPPVKKRCISLEAFMQNRFKQQKELSELQEVKKKIDIINTAKKNAIPNQPASSLQCSAGFKSNSVQKVFDSTSSDSSGVSSGGQNFHEPIAPQAPAVQSNNSGSSSGQFPAAANSNFGVGFENELLRIAIQFGPQPRLRKFVFQIDNQLREDFALDNFDSPNPVVRMSRFKFNWIFQDQPQMSRKFQPSDQSKSGSETSEAEKNQSLFSARQKNRIGTAISDIEEFITKQMTREKMFLISKYRAFHKVLNAALHNAGRGSV